MQNQVIGHFQVHERVGAGGMGTVYRAVDVRLGREVALKFLSPAITEDPTARQRFVREARAAAALDHPNVCTVFEVGETEDGSVYLAMPLYRGETLSKRLRRGAMNPGEAVRFAVQLLAALEQAHGRGILHRDLKPSNIFITSEGVVKLLDFGLARLAHEARLTGSGTLVGTAAYMAPELVLSQQGDHRADLWSAGVVLYEMLTGELPYAARSEAHLVYAIAHEGPRPLRELRPDLPDDVIRVVDRALSRDLEQRYATAGVMRRDLEALGRALQDAEPATEAFPGSSPSSVVAPPRAAISRPPSVSTPRTLVVSHRTAWIGGAVAAALLVAAVAAVWLLPRGAGPASAAIPRNLAILPVMNRSGDARLDPIAQGLGTVLGDQLGAVPALNVLPADEVQMVYRRSRSVGVRDVAKELGADAVLRGELRQHGADVEVQIALVDGASGAERWSTTVADDRDRLLGVQERLADRVATELLGSLAAAGGSLKGRVGASEEAYRKYLLAEAQYEDLEEAGDLEPVAELLRAAVKLDPQFALAHARLAEVLTQQHDSEARAPTMAEALARASDAMRLAPDLPQARIAQAHVQAVQGHYAQAIVALRALAAEYPNLPDAVYLLSQAYANNQQLGDAERTLRQALQRRPGYWKMWDALGSLLLRQGEYGAAREAYLDAAALTRFEYGTPYQNLANLELTQGNFAAALRGYDKLPRPITDPLLASNIGTAYFYTDRLDDAAEMYRLAQRLAPAEPTFPTNLGDVYAKEGKAEPARHEYGIAADLILQREPKPSLESRGRRALYLAKAGRCAEAAKITPEVSADTTLTAFAATDIAKALAACNAIEPAYDMLARALELGYSADRARKDEEFRALWHDPRFEQVLASAKPGG